MRKSLAYVQTIKSLSPIPKADKIEKAEVLGWECVVKVDEFKVGEKIIYVEIDSILPDIPYFEFLRSRKHRIRTIKLKSQISQGLVLPLSAIHETDPAFDISKLKVGDDVTAALKIAKYDPEAALDITDNEPQERPSYFVRKFRWIKWLLFGFKPIKSGGDFPSCVPKTDETRVQHMYSYLLRTEGTPVYITEKLDGTSATFIYRKNGNWLSRLFGAGYTFQVCSRNRILFSTDKNHNKPIHPIVAMADKYDLLNGMRKLNRNLAIQGETIGGPGPNIQGNLYKLKGHDLRVFLMFDIDQQKYLPLDEMIGVCKQLNLLMVPLLGYDTIKCDIPYWVNLSKGKSQLLSTVLREGIVIRAIDESFSFKSINPEFLLGRELHKD